MKQNNMFVVIVSVVCLTAIIMTHMLKPERKSKTERIEYGWDEKVDKKETVYYGVNP